jgi:hypothetical protein
MENIPAFVRWTGAPTAFGKLGCEFLAGCTAAVLWEIGEFFSDLILGTRIQHSIEETMMDQVNGVLGTITTICILGLMEFRRQRRVALRSR